jgi:hypothetical protein
MDTPIYMLLNVCTGVDGKHEHEMESPSFFNTAEVT